MFPIIPATMGGMSDDNETREAVGRVIRAIRLLRGLSTAALARQTGIDVKTIRSFETGERWPQDVTRHKLETELAMSFDLISTLTKYEEIREEVWEALRRGDFDAADPIQFQPSAWPTTNDELTKPVQSLDAAVPVDPFQEHFHRAERLLGHSLASAMQQDYLGALAGLEGAQSTVELLISRMEMAATQKENDHALEESTESSASAEAVEGQEALTDKPKGEDRIREVDAIMASVDNGGIDDTVHGHE